jgi:hypothetical protein
LERYQLEQLNRASRFKLYPLPGVDPALGWFLVSAPNVKARVVLDPYDCGELSSFAAHNVADRHFRGLLELNDIDVESADLHSDFVLPFEFIVGRVLATTREVGPRSARTSSLMAGGGIRGYWGTVAVSGRTGVRGLPGKYRFKDAVIDGRNPEVVWFVAADFMEAGKSACRLSLTSNSRGNWVGSLALHLPLGR